jgi:hypothetical protein
MRGHLEGGAQEGAGARDAVIEDDLQLPNIGG